MSKTYRVAVIGRTGRGNYGHGIDTVWADVPQTQVVAVADDDKMGLAAAAKRLKVDKAFADYRSMLDEMKPDIVAIAPRWIDKHAEMAIECAQRGMHLYMEKPFCPTLEQADAVVAACEKAHVKLVISHQTRYSPRVEAVQKFIAEGKLGRVIEYRGRGKEDAKRGGGEDTWVLGSHIMDLIRAFGGHPQWCFGSVTQQGKPITKADVIDGNEGIGPLAGDAIRATYAMPDGSTAYFGSVRGAGGNPSRFGLQILGTAGVIEILTGHIPSTKFSPDPSWAGRGGKPWQELTTAGLGAVEPIKDGGLHGGNVLAVQDLLKAIEENREPRGGVYEARGATEMIVAIFESQRQGKPVSLPLANRKNPLTMLA
ncbi:MAG: Gfo/Idh/MocA family oxidoreductase [Planctomycetaceae bacterium]|nr:Gfo/Idh/MocA family oxidoreductase [Planctomycetaceae bacterium]